MLVDVVATDAAGRPVSDLVRDDFLLTEVASRDNSNCRSRRSSVSRAGDNDVAPPSDNVLGNVDEGRVYIIIVDGFHMTSAGAYHALHVAEQFIREYIQPHNMVAMGRLGIVPRGFEFTADRSRPLHLLDAVAPGTVSSASGQPREGTNGGSDWDWRILCP